MRSLLGEIAIAWQILSGRGRRTLLFYGASLSILAGLDAGALVLISRLFNGSEPSISADFASFGVVILLFVTRTLLSTVVSWWALRALAVEEVAIGSRNLTRLVHSGIAESLSEVDYYNAVDRGPSSLTQGLMMHSVTIASETAITLVILTTLLVLDFTTAVSSTVYFVSVAFIQNKLLSQRALRAGEVGADQTASVYEILLDGFKLRKVLSVMPSTSFETSLKSRRRLLAESRANVAFMGTLPRYTMELVLSLGLIVVCGVAFLVNGERGAVEAAAIFGVAGFRLLPAINRIQGLVLMLFSAVPTARLAQTRKLDNTLTLVQDTPDGADEIIALRNVSYRYPDTSTDVLRDVTISFKRGLQYAVIGPSGAGKTTLLDILLGLLLPTTGKVLTSLGMRVGYVPQDTYLARVSLQENIAVEWTTETIDKHLLTNIVETVALSDIAERFMSETDERLSDALASGGQRQRIGLARALYRNPSLLVLDEVTSSLDSETEHLIMKHVQSMRESTTVIIVAHRLTTVQHADQVVYIEDGQVLGVGTFNELRQSLPQLQRQIELGTLDLNP